MVELRARCRRLFAALLLLPGFTPRLSAAESAIDPTSEMTKALSVYAQNYMLNGDDWQGMGEEAKAAYLLGHEDGVMNTALRNIPDDDHRTGAISQLPTATGRMPTEAIMEELDAFYADAAKAGIPIPFALTVIARRHQFARHGATAERRRKFEEWAEQLPNAFPPSPAVDLEQPAGASSL